MSAHDPARIDEAFLNSWNSHDANQIVGLLADHGTWHDIGSPVPFPSKDAVRQYVSAWYTAFPDLTARTKHRVINGDHIAAEVEFTGTHTGPMQMGPGAPAIPPTGKRVVGKGTYFMRVADGKIAEVRTYPDVAGLMMQLGLLPSPQAK